MKGGLECIVCGGIVVSMRSGFDTWIEVQVCVSPLVSGTGSLHLAAWSSSSQCSQHRTCLLLNGVWIGTDCLRFCGDLVPAYGLYSGI